MTPITGILVNTTYYHVLGLYRRFGLIIQFIGQ
jgi:hypothetical protein